MDLQQQINQQRIHHIITAYGLEGQDSLYFQSSLHDLFRQYPSAWIEFSLVEVLVRHWRFPPLPRGILLLQEALVILRQWEQGQGHSSLTVHQFEWITGLTALPISTSPLNIGSK